MSLLTLIALWSASGGRRREGDIADERQEAIEARLQALANANAELTGRLRHERTLGAGIEN